MWAYQQPTPQEMDSHVRNTLGALALIGAFIDHFDGELNVQQKLDSLLPLSLFHTLTLKCNLKFICRLAPTLSGVLLLLPALWQLSGYKS